MCMINFNSKTSLYKPVAVVTLNYTYCVQKGLKLYVMKTDCLYLYGCRVI